VSINQWLRREGWLVVRDQASLQETWRQKLLQAYRTLNRRTPRRIRSAIKDRFAWMRDRAESYILASALDWGQARAFALGEYGGIFINLRGREKQGIVAPEEYDLLRSEIADRLRTLRDPEDGEQVIRNVYRREEVYHGPYLEEAPDLILDWTGGYDCRERVGSEHHAVFESEAGYRDVAGVKKTGVHRQQGILFLHGAAVRPGPVQGAHLMDIVPTLLHLLGLPVPKSMDGRVLQDALDPQWLADHPIVHSETEETAEGGPGLGYSPEEEAQFKSRLRSLGYLD
ncbi:MAG: hypothetical protein FJ026_05655, partial [Chloroflexi bacterium]|nr:hypothetical protein [Chloroflexota bacterium]